MANNVDNYFEKPKKYKEELNLLRRILLQCGLTEELKWKQPCYIANGKNVILLGAYKEQFFLSFLQGNKLKNEFNLLEKVGEHTVSARLMPFTKLEGIQEIEDLVKAYIFEAIEISKMKVIKLASLKLENPDELLEAFKKDENFKTAFENLTPGRQRGYLIYFTGTKISKTIKSRIENKTKIIIDGYGLNDCTCGHSKRLPNCDGSHKYV